MRISFNYNKEEIPTTTAIISDNNKNVIAAATVKLHCGDVDNKLIGRKYAFKKAVNTLNREIRTALWRKFRAEMRQI